MPGVVAAQLQSAAMRATSRSRPGQPPCIRRRVRAPEVLTHLRRRSSRRRKAFWIVRTSRKRSRAARGEGDLDLAAASPLDLRWSAACADEVTKRQRSGRLSALGGRTPRHGSKAARRSGSIRRESKDPSSKGRRPSEPSTRTENTGAGSKIDWVADTGRGHRGVMETSRLAEIGSSFS